MLLILLSAILPSDILVGLITIIPVSPRVTTQVPVAPSPLLVHSHTPVPAPSVEI